MPNIGAVLKEEIQRLARKEIRAAVTPLRTRVAELTRTNADLKKKVPALEKSVARLEAEAKQRQLRAVRTGAKATDTAGSRLGPRSIASQRKRLKLSRLEFGKLVGVSTNTVYLWERGVVAPREKSRTAIIGLRGIGVREARRLLDAPIAAKSKSKGPTPKARKRTRSREPAKHISAEGIS